VHLYHRGKNLDQEHTFQFFFFLLSFSFFFFLIISFFNFLQLSSYSTFTKNYPLLGGIVWELCLGQFWTSTGNSTVNIKVLLN